jgi:hypothetical protein
MRSLQQFWSVRRIGEDRVTLARLGALRLWVARADKEWGYAFEHGEPSTIQDIAQVPEDVVPRELEWTNMLFRDAPREFAFRAVTPDRPVVVKPAHPVSIPPGETGTFFVPVPVFVRMLLIEGREEQVLGTVPSRPLSDTWFGTTTEGVLCYSLPCPAGMDIGQLEPLPHQIICPLEVQNRSDDLLMFEKLCLRPGYVGLYCGNTHLWSSTIRIQNEGLFSSTTIRYGGGMPPFEEGLVQISKPEKREEKGLHRLTFSSGFSKDIVFTR